MNERKGDTIQYKWKLVQCEYENKMDRVYQDTHLQQAKNSLESRCDFPTYEPHYQFHFRNRWYRSFLERRGERWKYL